MKTDKNTQQLPAEVVECINNWVVTFALAYHRRKDKDISNDAAEFITDELGMPNALTEYATKLHELQKDYDYLKLKYDNILATEDGHSSQTENVWQSGYAAGHEMASGKHKREVNVFDIIMKGQNGDEISCADTARALLSKFISRHEAGLLPDRFIYQEIKKFLDGTK